MGSVGQGKLACVIKVELKHLEGSYSTYINPGLTKKPGAENPGLKKSGAGKSGANYILVIEAAMQARQPTAGKS